MWLIVQIKCLDAQIKDMWSVSVCPKKNLLLKSVSVSSGNVMLPEVKYFRNLSTVFNKQCLKWRHITSYFYIGKEFYFFLNFEISTEEFIFCILIFFCQHICSISTTEASNEMLWYPLTILVKKIWKSWKNIWWGKWEN